MKATGFIATLALTAAVILTAPVAAVAAQYSSSVAQSVAGFVAEEGTTALALASDVSFRIQEAALATTSSVNDQATIEAAVEAEAAPLSTRTIQVGDARLGYVDAFKATTAPERGAGLWKGSDSTTDGDFGYFIGHNPGDFAPVMDLVEGDIVNVCDSDGAARSYTVVDIFDVEVGTQWHQIGPRVNGYGESVVLQACCGDNAHYRVVVAV